MTDKTERKVPKLLPCRLTEDEILGLGRELARLQWDVTAAEEEKKAHAAQIGDTVQSLKTNLAELSRRINSGIEFRQIECVLSEDWDAKSIETVRSDTGEIVERRAMTPDELQRNLGL